MIQVLYVPNYSPVSVNQLLSVHWGKRSKIKASDRELIAHYAKEQGLTRAETRRRISLRIVVPKGQRRMDESNVKKVLEDSIVACGLLVDDGPKWCQWGDVVYARSGETREVYVILEDV